MDIFDMNVAINEANETLRSADRLATGLANMLRGRLRNVSTYHLSALKRELKDFNAHTGKWKS